MPDTFAQELRVTIQRLARRIRANQANSDLSESQRSTLFTLYSEGPQSLGSLSELERVTPPSMNRTVGSLVDAGLVSRTPSSDDARKIVLTLSDAGLAFIEETRRRRDMWFNQQLEALPPEEYRLLQQVAPVLARMADE